MKIVITCGYDYSLHTLALLKLLKRESIRVDQCIIVSAYSPRRIKAYYRQLDRAEFIKKFKDRILGRVIKTEVSDEMKFISQLQEELEIQETKVSRFCKSNGIPYKIVKDLNSEESLEFVKKSDLGVYSGGGILRKKFLEQFSVGVLNCHSGLLPDVRGMNSAEWSVLLGIPLKNTLHFMVRKLDLGPILMVKEHDYSRIRTIDQLRGIAINYAVFDLVDGVKKIGTGNYTTNPQQLQDGKQYFTMHPKLKSIVNKKLFRNVAGGI
jgi:phosphoribosylglycinamide formyltransferase-1